MAPRSSLATNVIVGKASFARNIFDGTKLLIVSPPTHVTFASVLSAGGE